MGMIKSPQGALTDEVDHVRLIKFRGWLYCLHIGPFLIVYCVCLLCLMLFTNYVFELCLFTGSVALTQLCLLLCSYWLVPSKVFLQYISVSDIIKADAVVVYPTSGHGDSEIVLLHREFANDYKQKICFCYHKVKFFYNTDENVFEEIAYPINETLEYYLNNKGHQSEKSVHEATNLFGHNEMEITIPKFSELFIERAAAPLFVFQVFCVLIWCLDDYWYYSVFTLFMLILFECTLVQQQIRNMSSIREMGNVPFMIFVLRERKWRRMISTELLPGDICSVVPSVNGTVLPCDLLLLRGSCIIDESLLTGESAPVIKEGLDTLNELKQKLDSTAHGKLHVLYGGTRIIQNTAPAKNAAFIKSPNNGCICYVLRTGFSTSQGRLLKTILFNVKHATANNLETFIFILFLLFFAIIAASYLWIEGSKNPDRNRYQLLLECILILTSVIPPELPIELSLAVNSSLAALMKFGIYCTEPFRIPFAGKVDVCCFDKTGTLTSDEIIIDGIAGEDGTFNIVPVLDAGTNATIVLACCHSLVNIDGKIVGDPVEIEGLKAVNWHLSRGDTVVPLKGKGEGWKIVTRYYFNSTLKRMATLCMHTSGVSKKYVCVVKGAPEVLKSMYKELPPAYDAIYVNLTKRGKRVLATGFKSLGVLESSQVRQLTRSDVESDLVFSGFIVISCPLKSDSLNAISQIVHSSHAVKMITGDNPLTSCHIARELRFCQFHDTLILTLVNDVWKWMNVDGDKTFDLKEINLEKLDYDLCVTGDGFKYLLNNEANFLDKLILKIAIFSRFTPKQKEDVINFLKKNNLVTLMCGDGTNDVGALKKADVGIALLSTCATPVETKETSQAFNDFNIDETPMVKLGDASIASPFTSKLGNVRSVCHVIKQGRCTLVITLQMFKILALNALVLAYGQSALYVDGVRLSDLQATIQASLSTVCFLFISKSKIAHIWFKNLYAREYQFSTLSIFSVQLIREFMHEKTAIACFRVSLMHDAYIRLRVHLKLSCRMKPLRMLSKERPLPYICSAYTMITVLLQSGVHLASLIFLIQQTNRFIPLTMTSIAKDVGNEFKPSLKNSVVYVISLTLQINTLVVNYMGHPFMQSLRENRSLLLSLMISAGVTLLLIFGTLPGFSNYVQIEIFPLKLQNMLIKVLALDCVITMAIDRICYKFFSRLNSRRKIL